MANILVVDDDPKICLLFEELLTQMEHSFVVAPCVKDALSSFQSGRFDLVLLDLDLPDGNGLEILPKFMEAFPTPEVIIITGTGDARGAELAFKYGAWDYVQKPFLLDEVSLPIIRALQYREEKLETSKIVPLVRRGIIGESQALYSCLNEVGKAAVTDASVLVTGETGTGKELFARAIHDNSSRAGKPFVAVDCGALPDTLVESVLFGHAKGAFTGAVNGQKGLLVQAEGGTLMLDEVGDLPLETQRSLLRTLQERTVRPVGGEREIPIDIRLVAATNLDLDRMVEEDAFRQDLLFRIRAIEIKLPPLRERKNDIETIVIQKIHELTHRYNLEVKAVSKEFLEALIAYDWPGNIRELLNVLEYVLASAKNDTTVYPKHLPPAFRISQMDFTPSLSEQFSFNTLYDKGSSELPTLGQCRNTMEQEYLKELIKTANGNRKQACRISGLSQSRLYGLLKKYDLPGFSTG